jgi:ClpP class serine protease
MSLIDLLWLFLLLSSLQPVLRQRILEAQRLRAFRRLEVERQSRAIGLIHRQETMSFLGFPIARYIDIEDSERLLRAIQLTDPHVPIDLILHTPGGLALAADEIVMADHAVLGPVDPQLGQSPAASIVKVLERKPIKEIDDETIIQADLAEKALRQVERTVRELIGDRLPQERGASLAHLLSSGTWTHDYPITVGEAREMGLTVATEMPPVVFELMQLYPQTSQRRPSVEYIPLPYGPPERRGGGRMPSREK